MYLCFQFHVTLGHSLIHVSIAFRFLSRSNHPAKSTSNCMAKIVSNLPQYPNTFLHIYGPKSVGFEPSCKEFDLNVIKVVIDQTQNCR